MTKSASIRAIELTRAVFESIHGNLGVLKFSIEELKPTNGSPIEESKKWDVICSFFESVGSSAPSRFQSSVNLNDGTVTIKKLTEGETPVQRYKVALEPEAETTPTPTNTNSTK